MEVGGDVSKVHYIDEAEEKTKVKVWVEKQELVRENLRNGKRGRISDPSFLLHQ